MALYLPFSHFRQRPRVHVGTRGVLPFVRFPTYLGPRELASHLHCIGLSGMGKSKFLASYAAQLILQNQATSIIDPHADLAHDVLRLLSDAGYFRRPEATTRLLYIDFSRQDAWIPFNVLRQPYSVDQTARNLVEACTRAWPALGDGQAPAFENILLAGATVLIENGLTLLQLPQLLTDKAYRDQLLSQVQDPHVVGFFQERFDRWGKETPLMIESTLRRIFLLSYSPALRYSLGQAENMLNIRSLMDENVSVIYNLGGLDEQTQRLLGALLTVAYEAAALSRADLPEHKRTHYRLVIDEFSMFSAQSEEALSRVLSLTRKFGLFLVLCHQTFSQLSGRLQGALQNSQRIAFRLGRDDSIWAAPRFGSFNPLNVKHTIPDEQAEPRSHPLFFSVQETYEGWAKALEELRPREAYVRIHTKKRPKTRKIKTMTIRLSARSQAHLERLRVYYGNRLLTPKATLETTPPGGVQHGGSAVSGTPVRGAAKRVVPLPSSPGAPHGARRTTVSAP